MITDEYRKAKYQLEKKTLEIASDFKTLESLADGNYKVTLWLMQRFKKELLEEFKDNLDDEVTKAVTMLGDKVENFAIYMQIYYLILNKMEEKMPEPWYNYGFGSAPEKKNES